MSERKVYTVATGNVNPFMKASRKAMEFMRDQEGMLGIYHGGERGLLWLFDTKNNAKIARNKAKAEGIVCGKNICEAYVDEVYLNE